MNAVPFLLFAALLAGQASTPPGGDPSAIATEIDPVPDLAKALDQARGKYADEVEKVAAWAAKKDWQGEAEELWEEVIDLVPDHKKARKALGYSFDRRKQEWIRDEDWRPGRNGGRVDGAALDERLEKARSSYRDCLLKAVQKHGEGVELEEVRRILDPVASHFPEDADLQKAMGRVEGWEGRPWVLPEAKLARERRAALKKTGADLRKEAPERTASEANEGEKEIGLGFSIMGLGDWRALATSNKDEASDALEVAWTSGELFKLVLHEEASLPEGLSIYVLDDFGQRSAIARLPNVRETDREAIQEVSAFWLDWHTFSVVDDEKRQRMDAVSRQCIAWLLKDSFGITMRNGWVFEGFGLYLSYRVVGTRLGIFIREGEYTGNSNAEDLLARLKGSRSNWFKIAHDVLTEGERPRLAFMLGKDVNSLTGNELLYGYVLSAYILEVLPDKAPELLKRIGSGDQPAIVLEETFGMKLDTIERQLFNWLDDARF